MSDRMDVWVIKTIKVRGILKQFSNITRGVNSRIHKIAYTKYY